MKYAYLPMVAAFAVGLPATSVNSEEWWEGYWRPESVKECITDSGMHYKVDEYQAWEQSCKIKKQQKIKDIPNAMIVDVNSCYGEGESLPDKRQLLVKLDDGRLVKDGIVFQKCDPKFDSNYNSTANQSVLPLGKNSSQCPPEIAIFESEDQEAREGVRQELKVDLGQATLKEYREGKLAWVAKGEMSCTNGTWVCHLHFKNNLKNASEELGSVAFDVVKDDAGNALALVAPGWGQDLYWLAERSENRDSGSYNGGLVVEWSNGFSPDPQKPNGIPASVFNKVTCPLARAE